MVIMGSTLSCAINIGGASCVNELKFENFASTGIDFWSP